MEHLPLSIYVSSKVLGDMNVILPDLASTRRSDRLLWINTDGIVKLLIPSIPGADPGEFTVSELTVTADSKTQGSAIRLPVPFNPRFTRSLDDVAAQLNSEMYRIDYLDHYLAGLVVPTSFLKTPKDESAIKRQIEKFRQGIPYLIRALGYTPYYMGQL